MYSIVFLHSCIFAVLRFQIYSNHAKLDSHSILNISKVFHECVSHCIIIPLKYLHNCKIIRAFVSESVFRMIRFHLYMYINPYFQNKRYIDFKRKTSHIRKSQKRTEKFLTKL